ncbi:unnamed protein product [Orchesella dallaii]|uniref:Uncharacterized protein n=1 Tax=Orchesella dallaii TaxID=48710 RepID=A0ABP1RH53_9HEXA
MSIIKIFCVILAFQHVSCLLAPRQVVLYDRTNYGGMSLTLTDYSFNLGTQYNYNDRAQSVCAIGIWIFYDDTSFGRGGSGRVQYVSNTGSQQYCFNLGDSVRGKLTSVRYGGHVTGLVESTFTLFEYTWFKGVAEEKFTASKPSLSLSSRHQSIIITGTSSWTVYEGLNYTGASKCLSVSGNTNIITDISSIQIRHSSLRSVRKGCTADADVIIHLPSSPNVASNFENVASNSTL